MKSVPLNATSRLLGRRAGAKKLRSTGRIPAVIYGGQTKPQNLEVSAKEFGDLMHHSVSENILVDVALSASRCFRKSSITRSRRAWCMWICTKSRKPKS